MVGGGAVGVEMAAIFRELGSQVTLVEAMDRLLPQEDAEMADTCRRAQATQDHGQVWPSGKGGAEGAEQFTVRLGRRHRTEPGYHPPGHGQALQH